MEQPLSEILTNAIRQHATAIDDTAARAPGRAIQVTLDWHPQVGHLEVVIRTIDHRPAIRIKLA